MRRLVSVLLLLTAVSCGGSGGDNKVALDESSACRTLRDYAFVGIPATYLDDGAVLLDDLASEFDRLGRSDISSDIQRAIEMTYQGPAGQLSAKSILTGLANSNCVSSATRSTEGLPSSEPTDAPSSPAELLSAYNFAVTTEIFDHACGTFALGQTSGPPTLLLWDGVSWSKVETLVDLAGLDDSRSIEEYWLNDVTGDGEPEIVINWNIPGAGRPVGSVIYAEPSDCLWSYASAIDSCGSYGYFEDSLVVAGVGLTGTGFPGPCETREDVRYVWEPSIQHFVSRRSDPNQRLCSGLIEDYDLPLTVCSESWAVSMAQEALVNQGITVEIDGQYGSGSQVGVARYQLMRGLPVTGVVDSQTWADMYPVDGNEYPDYDGDGVSSPREIGDRSGAFEGGDF